MKFDLIPQTIKFLDETGQKVDRSELFKCLGEISSSDIPELDGLRVDTDRISVYIVNEDDSQKKGVPLKSDSSREKFVFEGNQIKSIDYRKYFTASWTDKCHTLTFAVGNDVIYATYDGCKLALAMYTDVLCNGVFCCDSADLVPDTEEVYNVMFISPERGMDEQPISLSDGNNSFKVMVPKNMSTFNMVRVLSNAIRERYRKTKGLDEVKRMVKSTNLK